MNLTIIIKTSPDNPELCRLGVDYAKEWINAGHSIYRVFFYGEGVQIANKYRTYLSTNYNPLKAWKELIREHNLDAVVCVAAAAKRGMHDDKNRQTNSSVDDAFVVSGLGQLIEACAYSERSITFP